MFNLYLSLNFCFFYIEIVWYFNLCLILKIDVKRFGFEGKLIFENELFKKKNIFKLNFNVGCVC